METRYRILRSTLGLLLTVTLAPAFGAGNDMLDVLNLARESDPVLQAARASLRSNREAKKQALAQFLPTISATAFSSEEDGKRDFGAGTDHFSSQDDFWRMQLTQPIYQHDFFAEYSRAKNQVNQAESDWQVSYQDFLVRVAENYFNVLAGIDNLVFSISEEDANRRQYEQSQQRFEVGLVAITDVHETKATYDQARANTINAQNTLNDQVEALRAQTGKYYDQIAPLVEEIALVPPTPNEMEDWVDIGLQNNPTLASRRYIAEQSKAIIGIQRAGYIPNLSFFLQRDSFESSSGTFAAAATLSTTLGVQFNWTLFQGGGTISRVRQASYDYDEALDLLEADRRLVVRNTRNTFRGVIAGISEVEARQQAEISTGAALEATQAGFEVGTRTIVDVLNFQRSYYQALRDYARSRYDYLLNHLRLRQQAGTLEDQHIDRLNTQLAPSARIPSMHDARDITGGGTN